jgi:hypothetical protein
MNGLNMDTINREWASRPADERFLTMEALHEYNVAKRARSVVADAAVEHLRIRPDERFGMTVETPSGERGRLNNWSFGQLCARAHAPAGYLRTLPEELAAIPLQWSIENVVEDRDAKLLVRQNVNGENSLATVSAVTSPTYGRIYDAEMTGAIAKHLDLTQCKAPAASNASTNPKKPTTLYASDRDCFVCLVDDSHPIEVPGGNGADTLFRGFIARNSEVGSAAFDLFLFLYRYICDNRLIWGLQNEKHLKIRHTSGGPDRFLRQARPMLEEYVNASTRDEVQQIQAAQNKRLGEAKKDVSSWLKARGFTAAQSSKIAERAEELPGDARSAWNVMNAATELSHDIEFGDNRLAYERQTAKILDAVA